ncbi:hypothetical protein EUAN_13620 [Andreesenia angusta]|uniref:Cation diffusion facilitator family transporter n=1 Tax=Andreesenia angusta TaxID=39480 RepID=A0A1S1V6X9_9FIRM|nr:cation diffusion facilitator family transporter [Andreesenia angusta]OHW62292.1 hypothetical protein EUAN_13620 [Andreesenia angusta]
MDKENEILNEIGEYSYESFDFDELEEVLQSQLKEEMAELDFLEAEKETIGSPDSLGETIKNVIWEQFTNQIGVASGEDFIKENNGLKLDLSNEAHIQTTENFENGKIASHNTKIDYQKRYDNWQDNFQKDESGNIVTHTTRSGKTEATLVKGARKPFDKGRPSGSVEKHTDMDHTVSASEIIRDPEANAHMTKEEQITFANSEPNLNEMDSSLNRSKGDKSTTEWLDNPNAKGQKPDEIFDISKEDDKRMRQKDDEAREEYKKQKKEAEKKSEKAGKQSQKEEAFRITGKALRAAVMQLLAELVKEIIRKLVKWFKSAQRSLDSLVSNIKDAITSFVGKMKTHLINAGNSVITTIATSIIGPVVGTVKKVWTLLKQGWKSLKEAVNYIKSPENKEKPIGRLLLETGKIITAGLSATGAIVLGEVIEKGLMTIPVLAINIPLLGSLANILGIFMGATVSGIIGAIAINLIEKAIEKQRKAEIVGAKIEKNNKVLAIQSEIIHLNEEKLGYTKGQVKSSIKQRHEQAAAYIEESVSRIFDDEVEQKRNQEDFEEMNALLDGLLD